MRAPWASGCEVGHGHRRVPTPGRVREVGWGTAPMPQVWWLLAHLPHMPLWDISDLSSLGPGFLLHKVGGGNNSDLA